ADTRIVGRDRVAVADAADVDASCVRLAYGLVELQIRYRLLDVVDAGDAAIPEVIGAERRDRDRRLLQVFLTLARRDRDLFDPGLDRAPSAALIRPIHVRRVRAIGCGDCR